MYDNLHLHFRLPEPVHEFETALANSPAFSGSSGQLDDKGRLRIQYRGMRIDYKPGEFWGNVRGSLHTFAQGSNVGVFNFAEVAEAATALASCLGLPPEVFVTRKLEAGVNIVVPSSPRPFLETLSHHRKNPFYAVPPPPGRVHPLEYVATHADYRLKYYDKGTYATRQGTPLPVGCRHLLRFEVVFTRTRNLNKLTGRTTLTLVDLAAPDVLKKVAAYVHEQWRRTVRRIPPDYSDLSMAHAALLYSGADLRWWESVRPYTPKSTFKRNQALYRRLHSHVKQKEGPHAYDVLMDDRMQQLCPNEFRTVETSPIIGTVLHTCNHVEFGRRVGSGDELILSDWDDINTNLLAA